MIHRRRGLGAAAQSPSFAAPLDPGLAALATREELLSLPPESLSPSPWQPREGISEKELEELTSSVRSHGILEPVLARRMPGGGWELLAGHRRVAAAMRAGLASVPVRVLEVDDQTGRAITLTENLARQDLSAWEEAQALAALHVALSETSGRPVTRDQLAEMTGRSAGAVSESLQIARALSAEVLAELSPSERQSLTKAPKTALHNASRGKATAEIVAALRRVARSYSREPGSQPEAVQRPARGGPRGRPRKPWTLSDRSSRGGPWTLSLRASAGDMPPEKAAELLEVLGPVVEALRARAGTNQTPGGDR
jgi:ParB family transcriptional regulator, chromosome partitioning protein